MLGCIDHHILLEKSCSSPMYWALGAQNSDPLTLMNSVTLGTVVPLAGSI